LNGELILVDDLPEAFTDQVVQAYQQRPGDLFSLALSGGSIAAPCYERLAQRSASVIDWLSVNIYWGDERCVPADDPDSNQLLGRQALLERVGAANAVYPMSCEEPARRGSPGHGARRAHRLPLPRLSRPRG
jgi:6-phosphogluconolactonase/glucosamine-6-phosphate isomerase/deaminase